MKKLIIILIAVLSFNANAYDKEQLCDGMVKFAEGTIKAKHEGVDRKILYMVVDQKAGGNPTWKMLRSMVDTAYAYPKVYSNAARENQVKDFTEKTREICEKNF